MTVGIFVPWYNPKHKLILEALAEGIPNSFVEDVRTYRPCDVAVIFGLVKKAFPPTHEKQKILDRHSGRSLLIVESAFVKRGEYFQIGWGGISGNADFNNADCPPDRWEALGIKSKPWQKRPDGPVIVCGQIPRDTTVQNEDHVGWCRRVISELQKRGQRVLFRPHPRVDDPGIYNLPQGLMDLRKLKDSIADARCFVTWNSNSGVDAAIKGVPVVAYNPGSFAYEIASHSVNEELRYPSRRRWLAGLGYAQWTIEEMRQGLPWKHLNSNGAGSPGTLNESSSSPVDPASA